MAARAQGTVGGAGVNESLAILVNSFATERRELEKERREERRELLDRLEKASKDHRDHCEDLVATNEKLKV
jgi:hypothetical protein